MKKQNDCLLQFFILMYYGRLMKFRYGLMKPVCNESILLNFDFLRRTHLWKRI